MQTSNNRIPFGLKDGVIIDVSEVDSGLSCGCVCPSCNKKLQANKGRKVAHYFSHDPSEDVKACEQAYETAIHSMAKQILGEEKCIFIPELTITVKQTDESFNVHEEKGVAEEESLLKFDLIELEKCIDDVHPDVIAYQDSVPLLIEVAVTHFSGSEKIKIIRKKAIPAIEIDLSKVPRTVNKKELKEFVIDRIDNKRWLSNPAAMLLKEQLKAKLDKKIRKINEINSKDRITTQSQDLGSPALPNRKKSLVSAHP